jgi:OOP family OmpA-OmpF porin
VKLSERRAQAVVDYLAAKGVAQGRIKAIGMGEAKPIATNETEAGRAENRRVTIRRTDCGPAN